MTDAETLDQAITAIEALHKNLYTFRRMVKELGDLKAQYDGVKSSLDVVQQAQNQLAAQLEATKADLATAQQQEVREAERGGCAHH